MKKEILKKLKIPDKPGVYFFLKNGKILYIGKATSLKDRVKSYFSFDLIETRGPILVDLIFKADKIKWAVTDSVLEALILEAALIKKHQPKYNTKEKSDKSFNYVCITKSNLRHGVDGLPKVIIVRGKNLKHSGSSIFGPFTNGSQLREAMKIIRPIFPFIDAQSAKHDNFEFYRQLGLTPDTQDKEVYDIYRKNIINLKLFFKGKKKRIISNLKKEMMSYAKNREFEKANEVKKRIFALQHINDVALIKGNTDGFAGKEIFGPAPFFGRIKGTKVGPSDTKISLPASPFRIEAYDIAHMGGKNMVGVMVVVEDGETARNEYRKFSARGGSAFGGKTILGNSKANDTGALAEVLDRRLSHKEWPYPGLIVVDGGVAQINVARKISKKAEVQIPIVSVLKDERHRPKALMGDKNLARKYEQEILLANSEAHRFAISYHKKMRAKNFLK